MGCREGGMAASTITPLCHLLPSPPSFPGLPLSQALPLNPRMVLCPVFPFIAQLTRSGGLSLCKRKVPSLEHTCSHAAPRQAVPHMATRPHVLPLFQWVSQATDSPCASLGCWEPEFQALHPESVGSEPFGVLAQVGQCGVEAFPAGNPCGIWGQWALEQSTRAAESSPLKHKCVAI